jgi:hypothetical protein
MSDEPDEHTIDVVDVPGHQDIPMHGGFKLKQANSKRVKTGGDNLKMQVVVDVVSDLLEEAFIVSWLQHSLNVNRNGELLMGIDWFTREVHKGPGNPVLPTMLYLELWWNEGFRVD